MERYFSPVVLVELFRTSSSLVFAKDLSSASKHRSHGYSARGPYGVKMAFVVWRTTSGASVPRRDSRNGQAHAVRR